MSAAPESSLFAAGVLVLAAGSVTAFGLRRPRYAGWAWWVTALWLTAAGVALAALVPGRWGEALATPLQLQWPLVTLIGLRRFHAREPWPGRSGNDAALLAAAMLLAFAGPLWLGGDAAWLLLATGLVVHLYAAAVLFMAPGSDEGPPLQGLGATMALAAFAPGIAGLLPDSSTVQPALAAQARATAATLSGVVLGFVALTLACDRTERQLRESRRRLRHLANLDALTQVPNRRHFTELAQQALMHDPAGSAVLLLFDVDHFKQINDHLGHAAGDRALCLVSVSVQEHLRAVDVAGRYGGDEFALLLRRAETADAMGVAARIVAEVHARAESAQLPTLSLSFGLVQVRAGEALDAALRRADQALYEAKRQGRSRAVAAQGDEEQPVFSESRPLGLLPA